MDGYHIDKFGHSLKKGRDGRDGLLSLIKWFGPLVDEWWKRIELCSFYFDTPRSGLIFREKQAVGLKNFASGHNANAQTVVEKLEKILLSGKYALTFTKSEYMIYGVDFCYPDNWRTIIVLSFFVNEYSHSSQTICANEKQQRGITLEGHDLLIWNSSSTNIKVPYKARAWNIVYIAWNTGSQSHYSINDISGSFKTLPASEYVSNFLYLGCNGDREGHRKNFFSGKIARFDLYTSERTDEELPTVLKNLLLKTHRDIVPDDDDGFRDGAECLE